MVNETKKLNELDCLEGLNRLGVLSKEGKDRIEEIKLNNYGPKMKTIALTDFDIQRLTEGRSTTGQLRETGEYVLITFAEGSKRYMAFTSEGEEK